MAFFNLLLPWTFLPCVCYVENTGYKFSHIIHSLSTPHNLALPYDLFSNLRRRSISYSSAFLFLLASSAVIFLPP